MKVNIGSYIHWIGPYQISDFLFKRLLGEDIAEKIGDFLIETWLNNVCQWIHDKRKRKTEVHIDEYDTWSLDYTLTLIILPALKSYRETVISYSRIDEDDIPEDKKHLDKRERWNYILDEMIYAFESATDDFEEPRLLKYPNGLFGWPTDYTDHLKRTERGRILFGKYYHRLWN